MNRCFLRGKKIGIVLGALLLALLLIACAKPAEQAEVSAQTENGTEDAFAIRTTDAVISEPAAKRRMTLMVYMIGSDLESKVSAGVNDLLEIAQSGTDVSDVNVVVYTGGTTMWHHDGIPEEENCILFLTEDGFSRVSVTKGRSMGEADNFAAFLNAAVTYFPADHYALILWDHGFGPVKGYGKDTLFESDVLTLSEMRQAMEQTPFGTDLRLDWIGFDACLMASAELASVWYPYADYLVASQEIEPSIGWNYGVLSEVLGSDTETALSQLSAHYLSDCLSYFEEAKTNSRRRVATLAVLDLKEVPALTDAINALFTAAQKTVGTDYDTLAYSRANTRALGRTSTGSEYDLVDLNDLSQRMQEAFPAESAALCSAIDRMVVRNSTNCENLCGLSLYYPFFNKPYYLKQWADAYAELGLFPAYQSYLKEYADIWTGDDLKTEFAYSGVPKQEGEGLYALKLTPEQAEHFVGARIFVLDRYGDDAYIRYYTGEDVWLDGTTLYGRFRGKTIVAWDESTGAGAQPVVDEIERIDGQTTYSVFAVLSDDAKPESERKEPVPVRIVISVDDETDELSILAVQRDDGESTREDTVAAGKQEDVDVYAYTTITYPLGHIQYVTRANGVVEPFESWVEDSATAYVSHSMRVQEGLGLRYAYHPTAHPLAIAFEIVDSQNNAYCSEPNVMQTGGTADNPIDLGNLFQIEVSVWADDADSFELYSVDGVTVRLRKETGSVLLELENGSGEDVELYVVSDLQYNLNVYPEEGTGFGTTGGTPDPVFCRAGETKRAALSFGYSKADRYGRITIRNLLLCTAVGKTSAGSGKSNYAWLGKELLAGYRADLVTLERPYTVSGEDVFFAVAPDSASYYGANAEPQILWEDAEIRLTLDAMSCRTSPTDGFGDPTLLYISVENLSDDSVAVSCPYAVVNGWLILDTYDAKGLIRTRCSREGMIILMEDLQKSVGLDRFLSIGSVESLEIAVARYEDPLKANPTDIRLCPIRLSEHGPADAKLAEGTLLFEKDGVRISYLGWNESLRLAYLRVDNRSGQDISLELDGVRIDGKEAEGDKKLSMLYSETGQGQSRVCMIGFVNCDPERIAFRPIVLDITHNRVLFKGETDIELSKE